MQEVSQEGQEQARSTPWLYSQCGSYSHRTLLCKARELLSRCPPDTCLRWIQDTEGWVPCHDDFITRHLVTVERDRRHEVYSWICHEPCDFGQVIPPDWNHFFIYKRNSCLFTHSFFLLQNSKTTIKHIQCIWHNDKLWGYKTSKTRVLTTVGGVDCIKALILHSTLCLIYLVCIWFCSPSH